MVDASCHDHEALFTAFFFYKPLGCESASKRKFALVFLKVTLLGKQDMVKTFNYLSLLRGSALKIALTCLT